MHSIFRTMNSDHGVEQGGISLRVEPDREHAVCEVGELCSFAVSGSGVSAVPYTVQWDDGRKIDSGTIELADGKAKIRASGDRPGVLQVHLKLDDEVTTACGVAIAPGDIEPSLDIPEDFDEFWNSRKAELAKIPLKYTAETITRDSHPHLHTFSHEQIQGFDTSAVDIDYMTLDALGDPATGIYTRPKVMEEGKHPAVLHVLGAGVWAVRPHNFIHIAELGGLSFELNTHSIPNNQPEEFYVGLAEGDLQGYPFFGRQKRETSYWVGVFMRICRALDFLTTRPEWDGRTLLVRGGSQGGALTIVGAYMDKRVTGFAPRAPGLCDHTAFLKGRRPGWPGHLIESDENGEPDVALMESARYFDCMNFLRRIESEALFSVGLLDPTCLPSSVLSAFNCLKGPKSIYLEPFAPHCGTQEGTARLDAFIAERVAQARADRCH